MTPEALNLVGGIVVGGLALLSVAGIWRALLTQPRWMPVAEPSVPRNLDPDALVEALLDDIARDPAHAHGRAQSGSLIVTARRAGDDEHGRRWSQWHQWTISVQTPRCSFCITAPTQESMATRLLIELRALAGTP